MTIYQMIDDHYTAIEEPWDLLDSVRTFLDDNRDWGGVINFCYYDGNIYCGWHNLGMKIPHSSLEYNFKLPTDKTYRLQFYVNSRVNDKQIGLKGLYHSDVSSSWEKENPLSAQALEVIQKFTDKIEKEWNYNFMTSRRKNDFRLFCDKKDCIHYNNYGRGCMAEYVRIEENGCTNYIKDINYKENK